MLRERRRHANFKPNRRLDAKSSRGMIYENEELRLRTININAEVEKGHSDIKKLKKENDQLRREIWTLRDEYDKLENLLRNQNGLHQDEDGGSNYSQSEEDSSTYDEEQNDEYELEQNYDLNNHHHDSKSINSSQSSFKSNKDNLHVNFDHLSIVSEENSDQSPTNHTEGGQLTRAQREAMEAQKLAELQSIVPPLTHFENLPYDQMGPSIDEHGHIRRPTDVPHALQPQQALKTQISSSTSTTDSTSSPKHFFSPIKKPTPPPPRSGPDVFVHNAMANENPFVFTPPPNPTAPLEPIYAAIVKNSGSMSPSAFQTGGNLEDLLQDIEALSQDIMLMQQDNKLLMVDGKPYKSEINLYLEYPDGNPVIKSVESNAATDYSTLNSVDEKMSVISLPEPMKLLPNNLNYGSYEHFNAAYEPPTITPPPSFAAAVQNPTANGSKPTTPASVKRSMFSKMHKKDKKSSNDKSKTDSPTSTSNETTQDGGSEPPKILRNESSSSVVSTKSAQKGSKSDSADKKPRRVSLFFSERKEKKEAEREKKKEMEANTNLNALLANRRMSLDALTAASAVSHSPTRRHSSQHRKLSQESLHVKRTNSSRSNSSVKRRTRRDTDEPSDRGTSQASSRESSLSTTPRTRRISIVSHGGGKIPWCGCWGNGCV